MVAVILGERSAQICLSNHDCARRNHPARQVPGWGLFVVIQSISETWDG